MVTLPKNCWPRVLGSVVIQIYIGECMSSGDRTLRPMYAAQHYG